LKIKENFCSGHNTIKTSWSSPKQLIQNDTILKNSNTFKIDTKNNGDVILILQ